MSRLAGKVAIVTGGARGMGAATVELFASEGAKVVVADLLEADGQALAARLGSTVQFVHHDVTDEASWARVLAAAQSQYGGVDVLVNNAGVLLFQTLQTTDMAAFEKVLKVNVTGAFLGMKVVGAALLAQGHGSIVNISSVDGMKAANGLGAYCASKWALRGLTKVAAMEYGHRGVRVNSVHPGGVDTAMGNPYGETRDDVNKRYQMVPMQRVGDPMEVARTSLFLASDESSYLCGAEITVDGGMVCGQYYVGFPGAPGVA